MLVMYYNQDLFDERGLPYPTTGWTWDDFVEATLALRDPEAGVFGFGPNYEAFDPLTFIYQHGGRIFDDLENPTRTTFDDLLTIEALDWYTKLFFDHNVAPTPQQAYELFGRGGLRGGITEGKFGVWSGMLSERGGESWPTEWPMRWGMAPLPRDAQAAALTLVEGYFISSDSQHPDACWEWISYLSEQMPQRQAPVRRSVAESAEYEREVGPDVAAIVRASMDNALLLSPELAKFEDALGLFTQAFEAIMSGRSTPEEAMTWAQRESQSR
jgi:multiple sugar transport system substrate-binding protein